MPIVRRTQREASLQPLQGGMMRAAATALSEGADVERARGEQALAVAGTFERLGRIGIENYARMKKDHFDAANETAALNYSNALAAWRAKRVDGPEGAMSLKGESSFQLPEDLLGEFDDIAGTEATKATNAEQTRAFAKIRSQERQQLDLQVNRHVAREMEAYHAQVFKNHLDNTVNAAVAAYRDPKLVDAELSKAVGAIENSKRRLGLGDEAVTAMTREVTTKTHLGVISNLLATAETDPEAAGKAAFYFEQKKGAIDADKHDDVRTWLDTASTRTAGQKQADEIIGKGGTMTEQLEETKRRFESGQITAKVREDTEQRIRQHKNDLDEAKRDTDRANSNQAYQILYKAGRQASMDKIPPALLQSLDGPVLRALEEYAEHKRKRVPIETNYQTYTNLWTMARTKPAEFLNLNLMRYVGQLSEGDYERMLSLQFTIGTAPEKAEKDLTGFSTRTALFDGTLALYGINPNVPGKEGAGRTAQEIEQLRRIVDRQVGYVQQTTGKEATNEQVQVIIDNVLSQTVNLPTSYWQWLPGGLSPFEPPKKRMTAMTIEDVPPEDRAAIEQALQGRHYSNQTILDMYFDRILRGR